MESSCDFEPEILDNLYQHQLEELRELTLKLENPQDINLCRKWLQVFNKTTGDEKITRNCLCALMCQQLKSEGYLTLPFTDIANCNRDLTQLLANLDQEQCDEAPSCITSTIGYDDSHKSFQFDEDNIDQLRDELRQLCIQREQQEAKIRELTQIIKQYNKSEVEENVVHNISKVINGLKSDSNYENLWMFTNLFGENGTKELNENLKCLDKTFQDILNANLQCHTASFDRELRKVQKSKEKLEKYYIQELNYQKWQQKMKVKVIKVQFCSILSQVFFSNRQKTQSLMLTLFNELESKYKDVLVKLAD